MRKGGISSSESLQQTIRIVGFFLSALIGIYTVLIIVDALPSPQYEFGLEFGLAMALSWLVAGLVEYIWFSTKPFNVFARVWGYHILSMLYLIFITGFASFSLIACWGVLSAITYVYYSARGVWINLALMTATALADALLHPAEPNILVSNSAVAISLSIVIIVFVLFFKIQERDDVEFLESKKAELLEREKLSTLVNNIVDAVMNVTTEGKISIYNAAVLNLLDTNIELSDRSIDSIIELRNENNEKVRLLPILKKSKSIVINDNLFAIIGDERIRLEMTYSPIRNMNYDENSKKSTGIDGYIIILRDVTKSKSLEEERDEFISVVSHELRTPIAIAEGAIDNSRIIFARNTAKKELITSTLDTAHEKVVFLAKMVNDLSTLSRAERGVADEAERIDVEEMAHYLYDEYAPQAKEKGLTLNLSIVKKPGFVYVSRLYLEELIQNFVTNSIKYTKEGHVDLIITKHKNTVEFLVSDTGIGISKSDQDKIFEKFYRSEDYRTRETGGTGLGLYVAQKLSKKLDSYIHVSSRLNHGSKFWFEIKNVPEDKK
jgi:two-component system phosphate regulon sensor histidine kinase PhoR